ncbi:pyruvate dehydrogenase E2 component (dihydrolipoamide acetyltransferase)/2-oxoglutarate dehydrogenase E2 component (dihydrolipoamide succinyltransferase) [Thioclava dalianensis]|uniref:biotin/lipoyl-containing protein n=1 Tax=Thioclava dalianensis TaxID=1185766 RepID=UPI0008F68D6F|nr:biotin/lipoyl-containing protein [Thioclava dalianensis]SFN82594.1 pyruvate dehydrogenase E2 component (dihydrolipoamide acetyltransferase)/2-oxoglutarate dehydrogenase E2 component (dihydrolipoamide succinyltransferase) [Thioclava dalianensis]
MSHDVIMPALGMAQETGLIVAWLKAPGDAVKTGDPLMEVETDKATMEVEAQADGYLTGIRAQAGENVPVGEVVAQISESQEETAQAPAPPPEADAEAPPAPEGATEIPEGAQIIMPALGMAQDTGHLTAWHKAPGDAVSAEDILLEVETDKSAVEVPAGQSGYIAALLAEPGEDVPVGNVIAVISTQKPDAPLMRGATAAPAPKPKAASPSPAPDAPAKAREPASATSTQPSPQGRILASPKMRHQAKLEGLDLARLVEAGVPQPYHMADLEQLRSLADPAPRAAATHPQAAALHLSAELPADGLRDFLSWIETETGAPPEIPAVLAGLAAGALGPDGASGSVVAVERFGHSRRFARPALHPLGHAPETDDAPTLILRDLRGTALTGLHLGADDAPVLSLTGRSSLTLTLEAGRAQMTPAAALDLITGFAARLEMPLRHLL